MKRIIYLPLILCLSVACETNDGNIDNDPIDSSVLIEAREALDPTARQLTLYCATEKIYPCSNYTIRTETRREGKHIEISFKSVELGLICFTSLGPAVSLVDLGPTTPGTYSLTFRNGNIRSHGTLAVSDNEIELFFPQQNGIKIVRPLTNRVPDDTYWGTIGYATENSAALADQFIKSLKEEGAVFSKQVPGHYFYYEIDEKGELAVDVKNSGYYFVKGLIFQYGGSESDLRDLIRSKGQELSDRLSINIQSSSGAQINNWEE
jgi:hypothetical protein